MIARDADVNAEAEFQTTALGKAIELDPEQCDGHTYRFWTEFAMH